MSPQEFAEKMKEIEALTNNKGRDLEQCHFDADNLMCSVLEDCGFGDGVEVFNRMDKWYA